LVRILNISAKKGGPSIGKAFVSKEPLDEQSPSHLRGILQELLDFLFARDATDQIDAQFSEEPQVVQGRTCDQILLIPIVLFQSKIEFRLSKYKRKG
jgi:hypothetical protein